MNLDAFKTNGSSPPERGPDFQLIRQSTIFLLEPLTDAATLGCPPPTSALGIPAGAVGTAQLMARPFELDVLCGKRCGERLRLIATILDARAIQPAEQAIFYLRASWRSH